MNGFNFSEASDIKLGGSTITALYYGSNKLWPATTIDYSKEYFTIQSLADTNLISFSKISSADAKTIYWSSDKTTWNSVSSGDSDTGATLKYLSKNEKIYIKGSNNNYASNVYRYNYFIATHEINISGNIMSLIYGDNFIGQTTLPSANYIFCGIFRNSRVVDASNLILPATTLAIGCYASMFRDCTSLTSAPELPATTLVDYCYSAMFYGCTSLNYIKAMFTTTPSDSYTSNWVYNVASSGTFVKNGAATWNVIGNNGVPTGWTIQYTTDYSQEYLTIESLADNNTIKFNKYASSTPTQTIYWSSDKITWNSVLSGVGTTLKILSNNEKIYIKGSNNSYASSTTVYNYFSLTAEFNISGNIMSLIYGDNFIGQTTLPSDSYTFFRIFKNSKVIDVSNLILPATTLAEHCYRNMFSGCTSLTSAPELPATTLANYCYNAMFYNCTSLTKAPELPATTLASNCYNVMFYKCTSLTTAPELPATILTNLCYSGMFSGCTSLSYIKCLATDISASNSHSNWVNNVAATGTFVKPSSMTSWSTGSSGIPRGWTVENI